jgi:hypothetical protein
MFDSNSFRNRNFFAKIFAVDVITLTEYTKRISSLDLQNSKRDQQKTNFDCQIYKMQGGHQMGGNSFAFNSLTDRNFQKILLQMNSNFGSALVQKNSLF